MLEAAHVNILMAFVAMASNGVDEMALLVRFALVHPPTVHLYERRAELDWAELEMIVPHHDLEAGPGH